jgi:acetylornithine deacetylase/succinyl-diaminopimelate desuccinylase-like protein
MGRLSFAIKTIGKEVHSGTPHLGRNAIYDMAKVINAIRKVSPGEFRTDGFEAVMPINIATIQGGRAINIVPGECEITCERRTFPGENHQKIAETVSSALCKVKDVKTECTFNPNVQLPYIIDKDEEVVKLVKKSILQNLEYRPDLRIELGRTDSVYLFHNAGIKTVIVGPGHMGHSAGEYINTDRLIDFTEVLSTLLEKED